MARTLPVGQPHYFADVAAWRRKGRGREKEMGREKGERKREGEKEEKEKMRGEEEGWRESGQCGMSSLVEKGAQQ